MSYAPTVCALEHVPEGLDCRTVFRIRTEKVSDMFNADNGWENNIKTNLRVRSVCIALSDS